MSRRREKPVRLAEIIAALRRQAKRAEEYRNYDGGPWEREQLASYQAALEAAIMANLDEIARLAGHLKLAPELVHSPYITDEDRAEADRLLGEAQAPGPPARGR